MSLSDLDYKPRQTTVRVVFNDDLRRDVEELQAQVAQAKRQLTQDGEGLGSNLAELQADLQAASDAADEAAVAFTFQAVGRRRVADLVADCPPTQAQLDRWKEAARNTPLVTRAAPEFDYERFAPRLIAASLVEPESTEAEVLKLWDAEDGWSDAIWAELWTAAWSVNQEASTRPTYGTGSKQT